MIYKNEPIAEKTASAFLKEEEMGNVNRIMMELMHCSALGIKPEAELLSSVKKDKLPYMYGIAYEHDLEHLLGNILDKYGLLENSGFAVKFRGEVFEAIYRYEKLKFEYERICESFEENKIPFIPLKGSVLRDFYAEPWLRTSSDADILVKETDLKRAENLLREMSFDKTRQSPHDVAYTCGEGVIIELHFSLCEEDDEGEKAGLLRDVWQYARPREGWEYYHILDDNFFYFYHIAHAAKHFEIGGCGIKPVLDLHILHSIRNCDTPEIRSFLKQSGLERFEFAMKNLSDVWFKGEAYDEVTVAMEEFILGGGVYGNENQHLLLRKRRVGSKIGYVFSRIFVPRRELEYEYPTLKKYPVLLPIFEVFRWFKFILKGDKKRSKHRYEIVKNIPEEKLQKVDFLFDKIGL